MSSLWSLTPLLGHGLPQRAHLAATYMRLDTAGLEGAYHGIELPTGIDARHPEGQQSAVLVAVAGRLALDVRTGHEFFEA